MGLGKKLKKAFKKVTKGVTKGVSAGLNTVSGGLWNAAGGDDLLKAGERHLTGQSADDKREAKIAAQQEEERQTLQAQADFRQKISDVKDFSDEMANQSRTDYAGMGGMIGDDMGGGLVGYKKKKYGLIGR